MGLQRKKGDGRDTVSTRLYADTVRLLRILAEARGQSMIDYVDGLARAALERDGPGLVTELGKMLDQPATQPKPSRKK